MPCVHTRWVVVVIVTLCLLNAPGKVVLVGHSFYVDEQSRASPYYRKTLVVLLLFFQNILTLIVCGLFSRIMMVVSFFLLVTLQSDLFVLFSRIFI